MDLVALLVLRRAGGKYLLVEDPSTKLLRLPSQSLTNSTGDDAIVLAQSLLDEVLVHLKFKLLPSPSPSPSAGAVYYSQNKGSIEIHTTQSIPWFSEHAYAKCSYGR